MLARSSGKPTLHRSCKTCARGKRRCDQRWPRCSRCLARKTDCEYINVPLTAETDGSESRQRAIRHNELGSRSLLSKTEVQRPLRLEIAKGYEQDIISFLVSGMQQFPVAFAQNMKTLFIHPKIYEAPSAFDTAQDLLALCQLHIRAKQKTTLANTNTIGAVLHQKVAHLHRHVGRTTNFSQLLSCTQTLLLVQSILLLDDSYNGDLPYSEKTATILTDLAEQLWQQAPIQLPSTMSSQRAWLFAESVRRTIIVGFMLRSVYSLKKRNYSVRTPFVDSLPFDLRTSLWDADSHEVWDNHHLDSSHYMVSLRQYSTMLENGQVHGVSTFGSLILAACKGKAASEIRFPSRLPYTHAD